MWISVRTKVGTAVSRDFTFSRSINAVSQLHTSQKNAPWSILFKRMRLIRLSSTMKNCSGELAEMTSRHAIPSEDGGTAAALALAVVFGYAK
jgi:hypothetical protein